MAQLQGTAQNVRSEQEPGNIVLRFVVVTEAERVPVEMRGTQVLGVLNDGDVVIVEGSRERDGVIRPQRVRNLTTNSALQTRSTGPVRGCFNFAASAVFAVVTGALSTVVVSLFTVGGAPMEPVVGEMLPSEAGGGELVPYILEEGSNGGGELMQFLAIAIGLAVALVVFYLVYIRPRRKQRTR